MNIPSDYRLVLLIDEVEAHLHPLWQRCVLPALLKAAEKLIQNVKVQVIASTHSPMVLASLEPHFDASKDRLFNCHLGQGQVKIEEIPWCKQGDITNWLVSEAFGLQQARSVEAERAIEAAEAFMRGEAAPKDLETKDKIHEELCRVLPGHDPFWPRWIVKTQYQRP
jgi:hypothetical protein